MRRVRRCDPLELAAVKRGTHDEFASRRAVGQLPQIGHVISPSFFVRSAFSR